MDKRKLVFKETLGLLICGLIYFLEIDGLIRLGEIYNRFFPCKTDYLSGTSFACYDWVDFVVILYILPALAIVLVGIILFKLKIKKQ
jgi:hypothetical protein